MSGAYRRPHPAEWEPPRKKRRSDNNDSYRPASDPSLRPSYEADSYRPASQVRKRRRPNTRPNANTDTNTPTPQSRPTPAHTKKERKSNPSTRIHSLKKLLSSDILPPEQRRDKERELQSLLFDQEKQKVAKATSQMIRRYHMVRFFERKKAERNLRRLQKARDDTTETTSATGATKGTEQELNKLEKQIHEAEVDLKYTMYSPLGEKYIGIFVEEHKGKTDDRSRPKKGKREDDRVLLSEEQRDKLRIHANETANLAKIDVAGMKPPLWYEVEQCMEGADHIAVQKRLQSLRDRKPMMIEGLAVRSGGASEKLAGQKRKPAWLDEDGHIDPADLDSEDEDVDMDGGVRLSEADEDASDGGFFD